VILIAAILATVTGPAAEIRRFPAAEARQGVAAGQSHVFAVDNSRIARFDKRTGQKVGEWRGDPSIYPHINSCALVDARLVCAASNYPQVPMASSVETFDPVTLKPVHSRSLGPGRGSLTWLDWHDGSWWACFAHYDDKGGEPGRDHRWTTLVRYSKDFTEQGAWLFPEELLQRMVPKSSSGGAWNRDGLLYVTGHDRAELYALRVPSAGSRLELVAIVPTATGGQAVDWDPEDPRLLWSIDRKALQIVASRIPRVTVAEPKP
jgi:hypothetical protein